MKYLNIAGMILYWCYSLSLVYFLGDALSEMTHVYTTFGQILVFIGAMALFIILPFAPFFASLLVLYHLVENEYWNTFIAIVYVFPGIALAVAAFFGTTLIELFEKIRTALFVKRMSRELTVQDIQEKGANLSWFENYKYQLSQFNNFTGRTTRRDFWRFLLIHFIVILIVNIVFPLLLNAFRSYRYEDFRIFLYIIWCILGLLLFVPQLTATVRRVRDMGFKTWGVYVATVLSIASQFMNVNNDFGAFVIALSALSNIYIFFLLCVKTKE